MIFEIIIAILVIAILLGCAALAIWMMAKDPFIGIIISILGIIALALIWIKILGPALASAY